jgi:SpoVK/Ycf46/Vps4 family AAA+-type ATPase
VSPSNRPERRSGQDIETIIQRAAKAAAKEALRDIGLQDDKAIHDVKELRDLLDSWREVRKSVAHTAIKVITMAVLGGLMAGVWFKNWK